MINSKQLCITYANPHDLQDELVVKYNLRNTPITKKWIERVIAAQQLSYVIDDPKRFYGFDSLENLQSAALKTINDLIVTLNQYTQIDYQLTSVHDQDTLNRLHHVFESEHGLLDAKSTDNRFKEHLCNLNLCVHRCESIARGAHPRHVVTYFGLPKTQTLSEDDYNYFESQITFGTVYINYAEIGKTLHDLMLDNDNYIDPAAFQPFTHYSADFVVKFWNDENADLHDKLAHYYDQNKDFFQSLGHSWLDLKRSVGSIPVADLDYTGDILVDLQQRQFVKAVHFL
jgi:hypothetical protein